MDDDLKAVVAELERLASAATPGEWELYRSIDARPHQVAGPTAWRPLGAKHAVIVDVPHYGYDAPEARDEQTANAAFIAAANPATVLRLIDALRQRDEALANALAAGLPEEVTTSIRAILTGSETNAR